MKRRFSSLQKDVLYVMLALRDRNIEPVAFTNLFNILNNGRKTLVSKQNLRVSCKTLTIRQTIQKYRNPNNLQVAYKLTESGVELAKVFKAIIDAVPK